ncbi:MAG: 16S rRNA (cytosine(967)-C(5))-methyltransferase [Cyanobacteria bacterium J06639_1]
MTIAPANSSDPVADAPPVKAKPARLVAWEALRQIDRKQAFADIVIERALAESALAEGDRKFVTELVYGITRRRRTLDALIDRFSRKPAERQPPDLRLVLYIGFYQLHCLDRVPDYTAVTTTVDLARACKLGKLAGVVNGILRAYLRADPEDRLPAASDPVEHLAIAYSYPTWLVRLWNEQLGIAETELLCDWFDRPPHIDLRVNAFRCALQSVLNAFQQSAIEATLVPDVPGALRLPTSVGAIADLPGFHEGWWSVQDSSAQLVAQLLDPQPGDRVIDCCAAPGGKTTHIAELTADRADIWALDRYANRLKRVSENAKRLRLQSIRTRAVDLSTPDLDPESIDLPPFGTGDRVLLDAPCSGLGTLHRHADARWRQSPERIAALVELQSHLLDRAAAWTKPGGILVYSTCTTHPAENQQQIDRFLARHSHWTLDADKPPQTVWPHVSDRDGFFMARLQRT